MKSKVTMDLLKKLQPKDKPYDVRDTTTKGLIVPRGFHEHNLDAENGENFTNAQQK